MKKDRSDYMTRFIYFLAHDHMTPRDIENICHKADAPDDHYGFDRHILAYAKDLAEIISEKQ
jgi:hypothetical protein